MMPALSLRVTFRMPPCAGRGTSAGMPAGQAAALPNSSAGAPPRARLINPEVIRTPPAALLLLAAACASPAPRPAPRPSPLVGQPLDVAAQDLTGQEVLVEAGQGKVVVIDFFATWCEPCRAQLPHLAQLSRDLGDQGLAVWAVSFDESPAALRAYAGGPASGLPLLWDRGGERLSPALAISRLPTTVVADRRGIVRSVHVGWDAAAGRKLEAEVRALLEEPVTAAAAR